MRKTTLVLSLLLPTLGLSACDSEDEFRGDDAPLSSYDELFEGTPSNDELPFEIKADGPPPIEHTELLQFQSPVKSQGSRGVCSIFSTVALMEHLYLLAGAENPDFSEQYLQWSAKFEVNSFPNTSGSNAFFNLQAISQFGIVAEELWPYESSPWSEFDDPRCADDDEDKPTICYTNGEPPQEALDGEKFHLPPGRFLNSRREAIMDHIRTTGTGVVVGLDFFYQSWNHRKSTLPRNLDNWDMGIVLYPNDEDVVESHTQRAGHSILIVGWDLDLEFPRRDAEGEIMLDDNGEPVMERGFWIFKNSWGTGGFGIENPFGAGYGYLSMDYVEDHGRARVADAPDLGLPPPDDGGDDDDAGEREQFSSTETLAIPDDNSGGIQSTIEVPAGDTVRTVDVDVDIEHTWRGDLIVRLSHGGRTVVLHDRAGGGQDDLQLSVSLEDFEGLDREGEWVLEVVDRAAADTGSLRSWSITLR